MLVQLSSVRKVFNDIINPTLLVPFIVDCGLVKKVLSSFSGSVILLGNCFTYACVNTSMQHNEHTQCHANISLHT